MLQEFRSFFPIRVFCLYFLDVHEYKYPDTKDTFHDSETFTTEIV